MQIFLLKNKKKMLKIIKALFYKDKATKRAEKNERNYKKWLRDYMPKHTNGKIELIRVWTDRKGENYYIVKDPSMLTRERQQLMEENAKAVEYGVTKQEISDYLNEMLNQVKAFPWQSMTKDALRVFTEKNTASLSDFIYRLNAIKVDDVLLKAALLIFFIDGENPYIVNQETQARKLQNALEDDELRAFFLNSTEQMLLGASGGES